MKHPDELIGEFYRPLWGGGESKSLEQFVSKLSKLPLKWHPGTRFQYGFSTDVLGRVIEVISGQRLDAFLKARILEPLAMIDTGYAVADHKKERLAKVYEHGVGGALQPVKTLVDELVEGQMTFPPGGHGLFSTLDDLACLGQMLCRAASCLGIESLAARALN